MESLERLKVELVSQKLAIEAKGGTVVVANSNPSPSEITDGIKSITIPDLTAATATESDVVAGKTFFSGDGTIKLGEKEFPNLYLATASAEDVVSGKTFYSGSEEIKTGTKVIPDLSVATATEEDVAIGKTFYSGKNEIKTGVKVDEMPKFSSVFLSADANEDEVYITLPEGLKNIKQYILYNCPNKNVDFTFNSDVETIGDYAFYKSTNIRFSNFAELTNLKELGGNSFAYMTQHPIDLSKLPTSITTLGSRAFFDSVAPNSTIKLHKGINSMESYCFGSTSKQEMNELIIADDINLTQLPGYMVENYIFNCDLRIPATVTSLASGFAYGCSFNNITIPATCTNIGNASFYCKKSEAATYRRLKTVTFESEIPPTFATYVFAEQDKTNGFKIYVPDNAVSAYKANARLSSFANYIYPISQKE